MLEKKPSKTKKTTQIQQQLRLLFPSKIYMAFLEALLNFISVLEKKNKL
jgi:hypothetical protein